MSSQITIVIPAYNRAHTLPRTLDSIARQTVMPDKVVLVDNASTDSTLSVMNAWAAERKVPQVTVCAEPEKGAARARNRGLEEVCSDYVMFFDSDDVMLPSHVAEFAEAVREHPGMDIFGRSIFNESLDGRRRKYYFTARSPLFNHLFRACLSTQRIVVRTSLMRSVGAWDGNLAGWDDYELGVRLLLATDKIYGLPGQPSVITYSQEESLTGTSYTARSGEWENVLSIVGEHLARAGRSDMLKWVDARRMILASAYEQEKSRDLADRLRAEVLASTPYPRRMNLLYYHNLYFKRLTWLVARMLFP